MSKLFDKPKDTSKEDIARTAAFLNKKAAYQGSNQKVVFSEKKVKK